MATFEDLTNRLDLLELSEIRDYHKLYDIEGIIKITDQAALIKLKMVGEQVWFPLSALRVSSHKEIWCACWKFEQLYGV